MNQPSQPDVLDQPGVYLLHFSGKLAHSQHYIGSADRISARVAAHQRGVSKVAYVKAMHEAGYEATLARVWIFEDASVSIKNYERGLKNQGNAPRLCPICQKERETNG